LLLKKEKVAPQMKAFRFSQSSPVEIGAHCNQFYHFKDDAKKMSIYIIFFALAAESRGEKESITRQKQEPSYLSAKGLLRNAGQQKRAK